MVYVVCCNTVSRRRHRTTLTRLCAMEYSKCGYRSIVVICRKELEVEVELTIEPEGVTAD